MYPPISAYLNFEIEQIQQFLYFIKLHNDINNNLFQDIFIQMDVIYNIISQVMALFFIMLRLEGPLKVTEKKLIIIDQLL